MKAGPLFRSLLLLTAAGSAAGADPSDYADCYQISIQFKQTASVFEKDQIGQKYAAIMIAHAGQAVRYGLSTQIPVSNDEQTSTSPVSVGPVVEIRKVYATPGGIAFSGSLIRVFPLDGHPPAPHDLFLEKELKFVSAPLEGTISSGNYFEREVALDNGEKFEVRIFIAKFRPPVPWHPSP